MRLEHYSTHPGLTQVDPTFMGSSGISGAESKRARPSVPRSYYYLEGGKPERIVTAKAPHRYSAELDPTHRIYDLGLDLEKIVASSLAANGGAWDTEHVLQSVKDSGYHGFMNSSGVIPHAVGLFYAHPVTKVEPVTQESVVAWVTDLLLS